jgi:hypothetical protein
LRKIINFTLILGKKIRAARKTKVNEFTGKETVVTQTRVATSSVKIYLSTGRKI